MRATSQLRVSVPQAIALACALLTASAAAAQTSAPAPVKHHRKPRAAAVQPTPPPAVVEPPKPDWPVNDRPVPASVTWDNHSLRIDASNSSLGQILTQITTATGAKIEGTAGDQRIFGSFGPGSAHDVLTQLLQGSGYNVMMVGDNGQGLPREVLLSSRNAGAVGSTPSGARPPQQPQDDYDDTPDNSQVDTQPEPPIQPAQPPENQPRTPQEMMQENQLRQQQQLMQQQGQQPNNPPQQQPQ